ncbi:MAG: heavy-metal-associated domain-containing protein [Alphaproteobacteria bacterium]|nr:heavy-metal-associated domain-containing protein [Alphaproteobacteria bacterium]
MQEANLKVEGMRCHGCEMRVQNALLAIEGVKSVSANFEQKAVDVQFETPASLDDIKEKIDDLGFEVIG